MKIKHFLFGLLIGLGFVAVPVGAQVSVNYWKMLSGQIYPSIRTWGMVLNSSSTVQLLSSTNSTSTNATSTNLGVSGQLNFNGVNGSTWASFCTAITGGAGLCDGVDASGGAASAGGSDKQLQFNDGGTSIGGAVGLVWDKVAGRLGVGTSSARQHMLDVNGRISGAPSYDCNIPFMSQSNVVADQLGSATVGSFACDGNMFLDVQGGTNAVGVVGFTFANEQLSVASGSPVMQKLSPSLLLTAANNTAMLKGVLAGSATSSNGQGIAMKLNFRTPDPKTGATGATSTTWFFGFNDETLASVSTLAAHALPSNGCLVVSSSTPNWILQCTKATVVKLADTGVASSTSAMKATLVIDQTGASVYWSSDPTAKASIPIANVPVVHLRPVVGVGTSAGITANLGDFEIGNLNVWAEDQM